LLSYRKIFPVVAGDIRLPVATYPRIRTAKFFNLIQPYRSSVFMNFGPQNFLQMLSTPGTVYLENLTGVTAENFLRIAKIGKFIRTQILVDFGTCKLISATTRNIFV